MNQDLIREQSLERSLPHSSEAETTIVGLVFVDNTIIAQVIDLLKIEDFYIPSLRRILTAMIALFERGSEITPVLVGEELKKENALESVGGVGFMQGLMYGLPHSGSIASYAKIVRGKSMLRQLIRTSNRSIQEALEQEEEPEDILNHAQQAIFELGTVTGERRVMSMKQIVEQGATTVRGFVKGINPGLPTPWEELNNLCRGGIQESELWGIAALAKAGKALALDTPIPTPTGWSTQGSIRVGDTVYDEQGHPCSVTALGPVMHNRPCYRMVFSDGEEVVCDAEHEWFTETLKAARSSAGAKKYNRTIPRALKTYGTDQSYLRTFPSVITTKEIADSVVNPNPNRTGYNHRISVAGAIDAKDANLPIHPYVLGVWLGDGHSAGSRFTCAETEILDHLFAVGQLMVINKTALTYRFVGLNTKGHPNLRRLNLIGNKHIPPIYLRSSRSQRLELLQGLMDTDGYPGSRGRCEFTTIRQDLAFQVRELVNSLGLKANIKVGRAMLRGKDCGAKYRVYFSAAKHHQVFKLTRKQAKLPDRLTTRSSMRRVVLCEPVTSVPVRCIEVNSPSHLYLCSNSFIPTHNSALMKQWAQFLGAQGRRVLIFTREMSEIKILFRMLAPMTDIPASQIRYGLDEGRVERLIGAMKQIEGYPIFIDAVTSNVNDYRSRVREMIRLEGIEIVFSDYLQLFHSGLKKSASRADEVGYVWRTHKDTVQDYNTRGAALAQFNREAYKSDKRPYFHQVEGSGEGEKAVDVGMVLTTETAAGEAGARPSVLHIDYQRDEDSGTHVDLLFDGRRMEFHSPYQPSTPRLGEDWNQ